MESAWHLSSESVKKTLIQLLFEKIDFDHTHRRFSYFLQISLFSNGFSTPLHSLFSRFFSRISSLLHIFIFRNKIALTGLPYGENLVFPRKSRFFMVFFTFHGVFTVFITFHLYHRNQRKFWYLNRWKFLYLDLVNCNICNVFIIIIEIFIYS